VVTLPPVPILDGADSPAAQPERPIVVKRLCVKSETENIGLYRLDTFRHLLRHVGDPRGKSLVDLAAGPCTFALHARMHGYAVTAVDFRTVRRPDPTTLGSIRFIQSDIRDFDLEGFDVILAFGIFYHLTLKDQIALLRRCTDASVLLVDTQIHDPRMPPEQTAPWWNQVVRQGDYEGILYPEKDTLMAAVGNPVSFWHTEASLLRLFGDCGFHEVTLVDPIYRSHYGARRFYVARPGAPLG